ncbi:hypothetical protein [Marvinbryantia formatexigens]|nr:hypothetical protein [Marvinbryantia formatexigens]UWO26465.1 hypothetical protein NQ534_08425 [Marvinbryantia formatexigens DSM 14469]SDF79680.1 hypothetical protein SAMN05660368_01338 [Marvinbryantia formatexigens]
MAEKKKGRRAHLDAFKKNEKGEYIYTGKLYAFDETVIRWKTAVIRLGAAWAVLMAAMIINGCIPAPGMAGCFYVLLPYAAQVVSAAALGVALLSVATAGNPLREYQYEAAVKKIPMRSRLAAIFAGASVLGELLYLIQNGAGNAAGMAALFLVLEVIACVCAAWICKYSKSWFLQVSPIDNLPKNHYNC